MRKSPEGACYPSPGRKAWVSGHHFSRIEALKGRTITKFLS